MNSFVGTTSQIDWPAIEQSISQHLDNAIRFTRTVPISGGDIHTAYQIITTCGQHFFIKLNTPDAMAVLTAEAESLRAIADTQAILTPALIALGSTARHAFLVLEFLPISSHGDHGLLGQQLAGLHKHYKQHKQSTPLEQPKYGFERHNFIGLNPQKNHWNEQWHDFWVQQRLLPQLHLAYQQGFETELKPLESRLLNTAALLLEQHQPEASLVHGDLWSGNKGFCQGNPVIFDPACYYGDREVDIAMTELFGGFSADFYQQYQETWALDEGYTNRKTLYNLYHILNHLNLFGASYLTQTQHTIQHLISALE